MAAAAELAWELGVSPPSLRNWLGQATCAPAPVGEWPAAVADTSWAFFALPSYLAVITASHPLQVLAEREPDQVVVVGDERLDPRRIRPTLTSGMPQFRDDRSHVWLL